MSGILGRFLLRNGLCMALALLVLNACASAGRSAIEDEPSGAEAPLYVLGAGDVVNVLVWDHLDLSAIDTPVRPDGRISTPLVEDVQASGRTPTELARDMEKHLSRHLYKPIVTVIVTGFVGRNSEQVRVIGEANKPQAIPYKEQLDLLDVIIAVGGLTEFAAGNRAHIVRAVDGEWRRLRVRLEDLVSDGDMSANVDMRPGDVLAIPEARF